jgi:AmmeMemoRadiSam system protein B
MFYPSDPDELSRTVRGFLNQAGGGSGPSPKAIIVPHAGYVYSGAIAASAYARVISGLIERVVLVGPAHRVLLRGLAAPESIAWAVPGGKVMIDLKALSAVSTFPQIVFSEKAHAEEHSLEVQLPFLREVLGDFRLVPLVAGDARPEEVADVLAALWGGPETLIVVSSDLSHYEPYEQARKKDGIAAQAIVDLDVRGLDFDSACGLVPVSGLVQLARRKGMRAERLDLRNSGDTAGGRDQVVGYGAFAFYE